MSPSTVSPSSCLTVRDRQGQSWIDLTLGTSLPLGNRADTGHVIQQTVAPEWTTVAGMCDGIAPANDDVLSHHEAFSGFRFSRFVPSADEANELALWLARSSGARDGYRVLTLLGSQHGGTFALRSASGRPDWQTMDGPVSAGFRHLKPGTPSAIEKAIDESVAAVMISPIDWSRGGVPFDSQYLHAVQSICRDKAVTFIFDETKVAPGVSGELGFWSQMGLEPDLLTLGTGWFYGLTGGVVLSRMDHGGVVDRNDKDMVADQPVTVNNALNSVGCFMESSPVQRLAFLETLSAMDTAFTANTYSLALQQWSSQLAELKSGFDFVREIAQRGWWTILALDVPATELMAIAAKLNLRLRATGDSTVLACPPVVSQPAEIDQTVKLLRQTLEMVETASTAETPG